MKTSEYWSLENIPLERDAAQLRTDTKAHVAAAKSVRTRIGGTASQQAGETTLVLYNEMMMHLDAAANECGLFARIHPNADVRAAAEEGEQATAKVVTELNLDRDLYGIFRQLDASGFDHGTKWFLEKRLRDFRRAGVDKSDDVRRQIAALNDEIVKIGQEFAKNIRTDEREILLDSVADLDGLPIDWIERHPPGPDGKIHISTRTPDYTPFMTYARNADARRRLYIQHKDRGYPTNIEVLQNLLSRRHELARLLGYPTWADYITEDKMIASATNAQTFVDRVARMSKSSASRDYERLLARKRADVPNAEGVEDWEKSYYEELVKAEQFAFDSQAVRPYFNFLQVQQGLFDLTSRLFGVSYVQLHNLQLWHPDVTAWNIHAGEKHIGRFYLDMHPREDKYGHAAEFDYRTGVGGARLPQCVLICNFPNPRDNKDGVALMEHSDVTTLFHEFGHLLHALFAGHQQLIGNSGISTEWDFVEVPSQMLEEWCFDPESLRAFARHYETAEPIPLVLVEKLRATRDFGKGLQAAHQMFYASLALRYYSDSKPSELDTTQALIDLQERYSPFPYVDGTHFQCNFGHLDGYSAIYYTYMWSLVIEKDLLGRFKRDGLSNTATARSYRKTILEPGGSKKAAELVKDFLGRPYSFDAFESWLNR